MMIEAITQVDYEAYHKFFLFTFMQGRRAKWQTPILLALSPLLAIAFLALYIRDTSEVLNLVGFILMLFMTLMMVGIIVFLPKRYYKSLEQQLMIPCHYEFGQDELVVWNEDAPGIQHQYPYDKIESASETDDYFYINLGPGMITIISRKSITKATPDQLHELLADKLADRLTLLRRPSAGRG